MLRFLAFLYAVLFIAAGIMGFLPNYLHDGLLFGYFSVNPVLNTLLLAIGVFAFFCFISNPMSCKVYFIIIGFVFLAAACYGFYSQSQLFFNLVANNRSNDIFYLVMGLLSLYFGFGVKSAIKSP